MNTHINVKPSKAKVILIKTVVMLFLFAIGFLLGKTAAAQSSSKKPGIFFTVTGNGLKDTSYLFGTYHLIKSSFLDNAPNVVSALNNAKGIVVEVVIDSSKLQEAQAIGLLQNKTLSDLVDKNFKDTLENELKSLLGVGIDPFNQAKPVNVSITLSMVYLMKNNSKTLNQFTGLPLDSYFASVAKEQLKTISTMETLTEQMNLLFTKTSDEEQVRQLKLFFQNKTEMVRLGDDLLKTWLSNDLEKIGNLYNQTIALTGEEDYLVKDRNEKWMKTLPGLLHKQSQFIGVGALHLAGKDGLVEKLRKMGYTVTSQNL